MDKNILNEIKNKIYETEGLLELIQLRPEKASELLTIISTRFDQARSLIQSLAENVGPADETLENEETPGDDVIYEHDADFDENEDASECEESEDDDSIYEVTPEDEEPEIDDFTPEPKVDGRDITHAKKSDTKQNPAFCLNDRFRFRRALFGGSDLEFNSVMDNLATLANFEEAEDYIYGELGFEPEDSDVTDFMEIIRNYFGK